MDHHFRAGASGVWEGDLDRYYYGRRANGIYVPRYRNLGSEKREYLRGFGYQGGASRQGWQRNIAEFQFGAEFKEAMTTPGQWTMGFGGFGETLPYHENQMYLDPATRDKWDLPEMGTARMGRDAKTSILNGHNQIHSVPNVFLTDGACMTSASCVNPSLTYMALTARAVDFAVGEMKKLVL